MGKNQIDLKSLNWKWALGLAVAAVVYVLARPTLNAQLGLDLPALIESEAPVVQQDERQSSDDPATKPDERVLAQADAPPATPTPTQRRPLPELATPPATPSKPTREVNRTKPAAEQKVPDFGELTEIRKDTFRSTLGLIYAKGSQQGHRLRHIMMHAKDDPQRPVHGVFDGDQAEILGNIDEAYLIALKRGPPQAKKKTEDDRTIWTVDLQRRIGYLGGQVGGRKGQPALTGIRLILEGKNVITAFPVDPRR